MVCVDTDLDWRMNPVVAVHDGIEQGFTKCGFGHRVSLDPLHAIVADRGLEIFG